MTFFKKVTCFSSIALRSYKLSWCIKKGAERFLEHGIGNKRQIKYIYNGIDIKYFEYTKDTRLKKKSELGLGKDGAKYMNLKKFTEEGVEIIFQDFIHPVYAQLYGGFEPNMSAIDLLFNCGDKCLEILRGG
ncbi:MAG: WbqC family protein [Candidatus Scalinduaceae bacterium]